MIWRNIPFRRHLYMTTTVRKGFESGICPQQLEILLWTDYQTSDGRRRKSNTNVQFHHSAMHFGAWGIYIFSLSKDEYDTAETLLGQRWAIVASGNVHESSACLMHTCREICCCVAVGLVHCTQKPTITFSSTLCIVIMQLAS